MILSSYMLIAGFALLCWSGIQVSLFLQRKLRRGVIFNGRLPEITNLLSTVGISRLGLNFCLQIGGMLLFAHVISELEHFNLHLGPAWTGLILAQGALITHSMKMTPLTRELVVERMNDGWLVLDMDNRIVDLNGAAEKLIGLPAHRIVGQPAENILSDWPNILKQMGNLKEIELKGSVEMQGGRHELSVRISPLTDQDGDYFGKLMVWRDVTERRLAEELRQKARDEMFILLRAISGAASRAMELDEFLEEANHQIVYSFQSRSSAIFLLESRTEEPMSPRLSVAIENGLSPQVAQHIATFIVEAGLLVSLHDNREPWVIDDIQLHPELPADLRDTGDRSLLVVPMMTEGKPIGILCVTRKDGPPYSADDVTRLSIVADEVAAFVTSDRQRQMAIVLAERQRLVRDLHDSVTQRLYALLRLTEAAQAGLETGKPAVSEQMLPRIADQTRQALKEMRLFLYGLQPVDLEHEGLVAVLHQRLAAVEGRADVKARLVADQDITLPLQKEVALYFITQEGLNNVLRHANAKCVTILLRKRKRGVLLVIDDDGRGFDPNNLALGGMGLKNMRERVAQVGGRIRLASAPGKGTRISVSIPNDGTSPTEPRRGLKNNGSDQSTNS